MPECSLHFLQVKTSRGQHPGGQLVDLKVDDGPAVSMRMFTSGESGVLLIGKEGVDPPENAAWFRDRLATIARERIEGYTFNIGFKEDLHDPQRARVGWLRAAFLIAFALFGYRYAFGLALALVRQQIKEPTTELLPASFRVFDPSASPSVQKIALVKQPEALSGIMVQMGWHLILLPHPSDTGFYDRLRGEPAKGQRFKGRGEELDWPRTAMYTADVKPT